MADYFVNKVDVCLQPPNPIKFASLFSGKTEHSFIFSRHIALTKYFKFVVA
jgi:hypothetical protein